MRDPDGVEWVTVTEAVARTGLAASTIRSWHTRHKITGHLIDRHLYVPWPEVARAERATRGRYLAQRSRRVQH